MVIRPTTKELIAVRQRSENERQVNQRLISRLEDELDEEHRRADRVNLSVGEVRMQSSATQEELKRLKKRYDSLELDLDQDRRERDDLIATNKSLTEKVDKQEDFVAEIKRQADFDCAEYNRTICTLKSEANTARAMVEAVENQLRSKFNNEQNLNSAVDIKRKLQTSQVTIKRRRKTYKMKLTE